MKRFTIFIVLSSLIAIPLLIRKVTGRLPLTSDENMRYDIEDLIAEESL